MTSLSSPPERPLRRHELVVVHPAAWRAALVEHKGPALHPLVASWAERGWPLIARRAMPGEAQGVALGLPLPPYAGKKRLSFVMDARDIVSTAPPPSLLAVLRAAPLAWRPTLDALDDLATRHSLRVRVFGSLAWCALTRLDYVSARSDLDVLLYVHRSTDLAALTAGLAEIDAAAPMRLDGELVRDDGAAANWREFHAGAPEVLVKTMDGVALADARSFLSEGTPS
ncbi:MAG: malonate decarboxylase holo-[acyl-carrier-protein] synthase [Rhizomicrobium sp.]